MPIIIDPADLDIWLKGDPEEAAKLMKAAQDDLVTCRAVSKAVNSVKNNGPELLA